MTPKTAPTPPAAQLRRRRLSWTLLDQYARDAGLFRDDEMLEALGHRWALVRDIDDARRELAALGIETREAAA